jgi:hypothetical protein
MLLAGKLEYRFGIVTDKELVKYFMKKTSWFEHGEPGSLVIKRYDGEISH